ncbi:MAG: NUDIX hydrolase [Fibrobacteria bacterium]|nr:NUDIX hydrolase [Fibrobacteria bacterium]
MEKNKYNGRFIKITEEQIGESLYERAYFTHCVTVMALDEDKNLLFIKELRPHETPNVRWKLVTGFLEEGQTVEENANRELQEEIGKKASDLKLFYKSEYTGTINLIQNFVLAKNLSDSKLPNPDGEDTILDVKPLTLEEVYKKVIDGFFGGGSLAYALLRLYDDVRAGRLKL